MSCKIKICQKRISLKISCSISLHVIPIQCQVYQPILIDIFSTPLISGCQSKLSALDIFKIPPASWMVWGWRILCYYFPWQIVYAVIRPQSAHLYRVLNPSKYQTDSSLILAIFQVCISYVDGSWLCASDATRGWFGKGERLQSAMGRAVA